MISHTIKILLRITHKRMDNAIESEMPVHQAGFRKQGGTRYHIAHLRWILERQKGFGQEVHLRCRDYITLENTIFVESDLTLVYD